MEVLIKILAFLASVVVLTYGKSYENYQTLRVKVPDNQSRNKLVSIEPQVSIWADVPGRHVDIMVDPENLGMLTSFLKKNGLSFRTMVPNVGELIRFENVKSSEENRRKKFRSSKHSMSWDQYHSLADIQSYLDYIVKTFPDLAQQESIGKSFENRSMNIIKICKGECGKKPAIWIDGGIHAREWISPASVTFMLRQLVEVQNPDDADLLDKLDWYFLPVVNPDGYEFTRAPGGDRLWRKTRSINTGTNCLGADANRNFGYHFNEGGSSPEPCSDSFHGSGPFSEKETQNIRNFLLHTAFLYGQFILLPWGYTDEKPQNYDKLLSFAYKANSALKSTHNETYDVGCIPCVLYVASGGTIDWTLGVAKIPYSLGMELRDTGDSGFLLPPSQIVPTGEEVWAFHKTGARQIIEEFGNFGSANFNISIFAYIFGLLLSTFFGRTV